MADPTVVCILIPTYNEAATINEVVTEFREQGYDRVLVMDGGSSDDTRQIAREAGADVVTQSGSGKGQAVREAIDRHIERPYVLMLDGDGTYRPAEADRLLEPLVEGRATHVIGNRFANMQTGAMTRLNRIGNRMINTAFRYIHGRDLEDILSGYRAFTLESARRMRLTADGFGIETQMAVECVKHAVPTSVVPITYEPRPGDSETNLHPVKDGARIMFTLYQMAKTNNPLFYFGSVGSLSTLFGVVIAIYVGVEWFTRSISHEVLAVLSGVSILFGIQLLMFGVIADLIVTLNREQTQQFERLTERLAPTEHEPPDYQPTHHDSGASPPAADAESAAATSEDEPSGPTQD